MAKQPQPQPKSSLVERTAMHPFELAGRPIRKGQVVTLDPIQHAYGVKAGVVALTDQDNALVPVDELSDLREEGPRVLLGDKQQTVELTDEEVARLAGYDDAFAATLRGRALDAWTDEEWARVHGFDADFAGALRTRLPARTTA